MNAQTTNCADLTQRTTKADYPPRAKRTQWNGYLARNRLVLQLTLHPHPSHVCVSIILALFHQICTGCSFFPSCGVFHQKTCFRIGFLPKPSALSISVLNFHQKRMRPSFPLWVFTKNVWDIRFRFVFSRKTYVKLVFALDFNQKRVFHTFPFWIFTKNVCVAFPLWFFTKNVCNTRFRVGFLPKSHANFIS